MLRRSISWVAMIMLRYGGSARADGAVYVRAIVLDTSGSMAGERFATAMREIGEFARQLPPSPEHPIVLVPFQEQVHHVGVFTDPKKFAAMLAELQAGGGTSIAAGLERVITEIARYPNAGHVSVLLYTDGEDDDRAGISRQEEKLDRLFGSRSQRGLQQSVVFCKRWEKANGELLQQIRQRGRARIIDAGELRLVPVTLRPTVTAARAEWAGGKVGRMNVELQARIAVTGATESVSLPAIRFTCRSAGVSGTTAVDVRAGGDPQVMRVQFDVGRDGFASGGCVLDFEVARPAESTNDRQLVLPIMPVERLQVRIPLPSFATQCTVKAALHADGAGSWDDPLIRKATYPVKLTLDTAAVPELPWRGPVVFDMKPGPGCHVASGGPIRVTQSGRTEIPLRVAVDAPASGPCPLSLTLTPASLPAGLALLPNALPVALQAPAPDSPETRIELAAKNQSPARWVSLLTGTAAFTVPVEVRVDGPMEDNTKLVVTSPAGVRRLRFRPDHFTTGVQTIQFDIEAELPAGPQSREFTFIIDPPKLQGAVQIRRPGPLKIRAVGPAPLQLVLCRSGNTPPTLDIAGLEGKATADVTPTLVGASSGIRESVRARLGVGSPLVLEGPNERSLGVATTLVLAAPQLEPSFFRDQIAGADLRIEPTVVSPALVGSRQHVVMRIEAPFKRLAFWVTTAVAAVIAFALVVRLLLQFTTRATR